MRGNPANVPIFIIPMRRTDKVGLSCTREKKNNSLRQVEGTLEKRLNNSNKRSILRQGEIRDSVIKTNNLT